MKKLFICFKTVLFTLILLGFNAQTKAAFNQFSPPAAKLPGTLKVMTFNIRVKVPLLDGFNSWSSRKDIVAYTISQENADVIGLQEGLDTQIDYLRDQLPQYTAYSVGRNDGQSDGETCAIFYRKSRFIHADSGTFWLSDSPDDPGSKNRGNVFPRICSWVRLIDRQTGNGFYVYNVHMSLSSSSRMKGAKIISEKIAQRKYNDPLVLMGDFNMKIDSSPMQYLCDRSAKPRMMNTWIFATPDMEDLGTTSGFRGKMNGRKIDHILTNIQTRVLNIKINHNNVDGRYPSDHYPVVATLILPKTSPAVAAKDDLDSTKFIN